MTANGHPPHGFGSLPRKEDARLIRGQGRFVDDLQPPGLLHGAVLRSPLAHARLVSIDISAALAHPRVHAVLTGRELEQRGMAWMPTLSGDVQAVLATDKVRFHGQEVAFVVADDRYSARDALELIEVEYEQLEPVVDPRRALDPSAPVIRDDLDGRIDNHLFDWETGDRELTERTIADSEVVVSQELIFPRSHPAPMET
ncbi:MAG: xanthine dehydrogenase family protein molybdopterin-binding subunit, partial [Solirubrobacteraceae bacterium]